MTDWHNALKSLQVLSEMRLHSNAAPGENLGCRERVTSAATLQLGRQLSVSSKGANSTGLRAGGTHLPL